MSLFRLESPIYQGQNVVVSYDKSVAGNKAIADSDGDEVASFTTGQNGVPAVVNNSAEIPPLPAPTGFRAEAGDGEVTLSWDEPGVGFGRDAPRLPVQDGRELRGLDRD